MTKGTWISMFQLQRASSFWKCRKKQTNIQTKSNLPLLGFWPQQSAGNQLLGFLGVMKPLIKIAMAGSNCSHAT